MPNQKIVVSLQSNINPKKHHYESRKTAPFVYAVPVPCNMVTKTYTASSDFIWRSIDRIKESGLFVVSGTQLYHTDDIWLYDFKQVNQCVRNEYLNITELSREQDKCIKEQKWTALQKDQVIVPINSKISSLTIICE